MSGTYVDIGEPLQCADHGWFWDRIAGVEHQDEDSQTTNGLCRRRRLEGRREPAEPRLHGDRHGVYEQQEYAIQ